MFFGRPTLQTENRLEGFMAMDGDTLKEKIEEEEQKIKDAEENFKTELDKLQKSYEKLSKDKEATIDEVKDGGTFLIFWNFSNCILNFEVTVEMVNCSNSSLAIILFTTRPRHDEVGSQASTEVQGGAVSSTRHRRKRSLTTSSHVSNCCAVICCRANV